MSGKGLKFSYASSTSFKHGVPMPTIEQQVTKWSTPPSKDALAKGPEARNLIVQRNEEHWANMKNITNKSLSEEEFRQCIEDAPVAEDKKLEEIKGLSTFAQGFRVLQALYQARPGRGLIPISLKKDWTLSKQEYSPADYAMLTLETTHEQRSKDNGVQELQQIPIVIELVATLLYGERLHERSGVCPQFLQIPTAEMPHEVSKKISERIFAEILFPNKDKVAVTLQVMQQRLDKKIHIKYIDIRIRSFFSEEITPIEIVTHWKTIQENLPMIKAKVTDPKTPSFLLRTRPKRRAQQLQKKRAKLDQRKARKSPREF